MKNAIYKLTANTIEYGQGELALYDDKLVFTRISKHVDYHYTSVSPTSKININLKDIISVKIVSSSCDLIILCRSAQYTNIQYVFMTYDLGTWIKLINSQIDKCINKTDDAQNEIIDTKEETIAPKEELQQAQEIYEDKKDDLKKTKIRIAACSKEEVLTLEGFDENKTEQFLKARNEGIMWYNIESFANYFNLQPHEMALIESRIIFPLKPKAKIGRIIDF